MDSSKVSDDRGRFLVPTATTVALLVTGLAILRIDAVDGTGAMVVNVFTTSAAVMAMVLGATLLVGAKPWTSSAVVSAAVLFVAGSFSQSVLVAPTAPPFVATWGWSLLHVVTVVVAAATWRCLGLRLGPENAFDSHAGPWQFSFRTFAGIAFVTSLYGVVAGNLLQSGVLLQAMNFALPGVPGIVPAVAMFQAVVLVVVLSLALRGPRAALAFAGVGAVVGSVSVVTLHVSPVGPGPLSLGLWLLSVAAIVAPWVWTGARTRWEHPVFEGSPRAAAGASLASPAS